MSGQSDYEASRVVGGEGVMNLVRTTASQKTAHFRMFRNQYAEKSNNAWNLCIDEGDK